MLLCYEMNTTAMCWITGEASQFKEQGQCNTW